MPGVIGSGPTPFFAGPALRRLGEVEPLELHAGTSAAKPSFSARASTRFSIWRGQIGERRSPSGVDELAEEERHAVVPRHVAVRCRGRAARARRGSPCASRSAWCCRSTGRRCPSRTRRRRSRSRPRHGRSAEELVLVQVLAAQDAVDVGDGDLDLAGGRALDGLQRDRAGRGRPRSAASLLLPSVLSPLRAGESDAPASNCANNGVPGRRRAREGPGPLIGPGSGPMLSRGVSDHLPSLYNSSN